MKRKYHRLFDFRLKDIRRMTPTILPSRRSKGMQDRRCSRQKGKLVGGGGLEKYFHGKLNRSAINGTRRWTFSRVSDQVHLHG